MRRLAVVAALAMLTSACGLREPLVVSSTPASITVCGNRSEEAKVAAVAQAHCAKTNRDAARREREVCEPAASPSTAAFIYECVPR